MAAIAICHYQNHGYFHFWDHDHHQHTITNTFITHITIKYHRQHHHTPHRHTTATILYLFGEMVEEEVVIYVALQLKIFQLLWAVDGNGEGE
jgi:hypothetical protein